LTHVFIVTQSLCRKHALTAYDAAYLELAMRASLAPVYEALRRAAMAENVSVL
jgi:predicted nucleic acid-binding protein